MKKYIPLYLLLSANISCFAMEQSPQTSPTVEKLIQKVGDATIEDARSSDSDNDDVAEKLFNDSSSESEDELDGRDPQEKSDTSGNRFMSLGEVIAKSVLPVYLEAQKKEERTLSPEQLQHAMFVAKAEHYEESREIRKQELALKKLKFAYKAVNVVYTNAEIEEVLKPTHTHLQKYLEKEISKVFPIEDGSNSIDMRDLLRMMM